MKINLSIKPRCFGKPYCCPGLMCEALLWNNEYEKVIENLTIEERKYIINYFIIQTVDGIIIKDYIIEQFKNDIRRVMGGLKLQISII